MERPSLGLSVEAANFVGIDNDSHHMPRGAAGVVGGGEVDICAVVIIVVCLGVGVFIVVSVGVGAIAIVIAVGVGAVFGVAPESVRPRNLWPPFDFGGRLVWLWVLV